MFSLFSLGWQSVLTRKKLFQDINQNFIIWNKKKFKVFNNKINLMSTIHTIYSISTRIRFPTCLAMWLKLILLNSHGPNQKWTKIAQIRNGPKLLKSEMDQNGQNKWPKSEIIQIGNGPNQKRTKNAQTRNGPKMSKPEIIQNGNWSNQKWTKSEMNQIRNEPNQKSTKSEMDQIINGPEWPKSEMSRIRNGPIQKWFDSETTKVQFFLSFIN